MNRLQKTVLGILLVCLLACNKDENDKFYLTSFESSIYYTSEIIPKDYKNIYGKWHLYKISGGFSGAGYEPDYDYLEIKSIGIYGLIKNDILFETGKIELYTFDLNATEFLQIKLVPENTESGSSMSPPEKYIELKGADSLNIISPCCDMYSYYYKRIK